MPLSAEDHAQLADARDLLENPGLAVKISSLIGTPIEKGFELLPAGWRDKVGSATRDALHYALRAALLTMTARADEAHPRWHKFASAVSGATGGAFGLPALVVELPVSTTIICRSIADIARANGEELDDMAARMACLEVFALGGRSASDDGALGGPARTDDAAESGYFAVRAALAQAVSEAGRYLATHASVQDGAPAIVRLVALIAARFQVQVSQKAAAQAVPIIGAAAGAIINLMFIDHFQDMSRGHFTVRRLERIHGAQAVRAAYDRL